MKLWIAFIVIANVSILQFLLFFLSYLIKIMGLMLLNTKVKIGQVGYFLNSPFPLFLAIRSQATQGLATFEPFLHVSYT